MYHSFKGRRRLRVGGYRVIYRVNQSEHTMTITEIGHRCDIYKKINININIHYTTALS
ncbi:MAG: type II toxin-antitoxin system RelE family toxin [Wolbachia sp.]